MIIREGTSSDISEIVKVLKASLGDELPISEEIWTYKHVQNPFGSSIVLLAEEEGQIIGVRAFMKWNWQVNDHQYVTYRAVDTATHPDHRGKGIFKKLTMAAVEKAKANRDHFIFNTPNDQSRPGYLKMGWEAAGKITVSLKPALNSFWKLWDSKVQNEIVHEIGPKKIDDLCSWWNNFLKERGVFTPKSFNYLQWRYEHNPLQKYFVYAGSNLYLAAALRKKKGLKELRITECIFKDSYIASKLMNKTVNEWCYKNGVQVLTFSPKLPGIEGMTISGDFGPTLTLRNLNLPEEEKSYLFNLSNWKYSLGDLELF